MQNSNELRMGMAILSAIFVGVGSRNYWYGLSLFILLSLIDEWVFQ